MKIKLKACLILAKESISTPQQLLLHVFIVGCLFMQYLLLSSVMANFQSSWEGTFRNRGYDCIITEATSADPMSSIIPEAIVGELMTVPGVEYAFGTLTYFTKYGENNILLFGVTDEYLRRIVLAQDLENCLSGHRVVVSTFLMEQYGLEIGSPIMLGLQEFHIIGSFVPNNQFDAHAMYIDVQLLRELRNLPAVFTTVGIQLAQGASAEETTTPIEAFLNLRYPELTLTTSQGLLESNKMYNSVKDFNSFMQAGLLLLIFIVVGAIFHFMLERRKQSLMVLYSLGWSYISIFNYVFMYFLFLFFTSTLIGYCLFILVNMHFSHNTNYSFLFYGLVDATALIRGLTCFTISSLFGILASFLHFKRVSKIVNIYEHTN